MLFELMDKIRRKTMKMFQKRKKVANKLQGQIILPSVMRELNAKSRDLDLDVDRSDDLEAEVTEKSPGKYSINCSCQSLHFYGHLCALYLGGKRHVVNLEEKTCTCREWQVSGKPCVHALAFITSVRGLHIESFVDECYSVDKFTAAYAPRIPSLTDMSQWPQSAHGFFLYPPILKRSAGRPRNTRYKGGSEGRGTGKRSGSQKCPICKNFGHRWKTCKEAEPDAKEAFALLANQRYVCVCDFSSLHCPVLC